MKVKFLLAIFVFILLVITLGGRASAAAPTGITVSPAFQLITISSGTNTQPISFKITNNEPKSQNLSFSVRDFNALNETGGLFFVGANPTTLQKQYGLAKWVSLPTNSLTIQPHQTITLNGQILNLPDLSAGGHYGALMISLGNSPSGGRVGFNPIASSLLFVTKPQGAVYQLNLSDVYFKHSLVSLPKAVTLRFQNTGNVHLIPRGSVYINNPDGKLLSKGIINENSNFILPSTSRKYSVHLNKIEKRSAAGIYKLHVDFRFDGIDQYRSYEKPLRYVGLTKLIILVLLMAIILCVTILRLWKNRKRKKNK